MLSRVAKWVVVLMLVLATGGHWAFLQSIAWVSMTVQFSRSESLPAALQKTLAGQHPCSLCKVVDEGLKTTQQQKLQKLDTKLDFFCQDAQAFSVTIRTFEMPFPEPFLFHGRSDAPPLPPPRFA